MPFYIKQKRKATEISYKEWSIDPKKCVEAILKATDDIGTDCMCTLVDLSVEAADWGQEMVYGNNDAAHPNMNKRLIDSPDEYDKIEIINPRETPRMKAHIQLAKYLHEAKGDEMPLV